MDLVPLRSAPIDGVAQVNVANESSSLVYRHQNDVESRCRIYTAEAKTDEVGRVRFVLPAGYFNTVHCATPTVVSRSGFFKGTVLNDMSSVEVTVQVFESSAAGESKEAGSGITVTVTVFGK
jgi:hypothetical protein